MYKRIVFPLVLLMVGANAAASVTEIEPNDDPAVAFPLPSKDAAVGQLQAAEDMDVYSITVTDEEATNRPSTPVYFGCSVVINDWISQDGGVTEADESNWSITTWGPGTTSDDVHNYSIGKEDCRQGLADITGPLRFQMNTSRPGTYYIAVWGRYIGKRVVSKIQPDGTTKNEEVDAWIANSGDYTLRAVRERENGEMEPNDGVTDAFPLPADSSVTGQLSSMWDEDWFYIRTGGASEGRVTSVYMSCSAGSPGSNGLNDPLFLVSTYAPNGNLQSSYQVGAARCITDGGFKFSINTPADGDYYVAVTAPTYNENARYSDLDYKLSQFFQINEGGGSSGSFTGTIRKATITDNAAAGKDRFNVVLNNCNSGGVGNLTLSGNKLDFSNLAETMQIKVQVGGWSCLSDTTTFIKDATNASKTIYKYPAP